MDITKEKFDLIVSLGEDCACSSYLRKFNLQNASYPFDWLTKADFKMRIMLLLTDFKDFLNKEDLKIMNKPTGVITDDKCDYYENLKTGFYFYHDFYSDVEFFEMYNTVFEKYQRRIKRLYEKIEKSKKVLFVWLMRSISATDDELLTYQKQIEKKFKKSKVYLLVLENCIDANNSENISEVKISDNITRLKYDTMTYDITNPSLEWIGNIALNDKVFSKLKLKQHRRNFLINSMFNCLVKLPIAIFIRDSKKRRTIREKIKNRIFNYG